MERLVSRAGCPLHYTVTGNGPVVLFIQGAGVHGSCWTPQIGPLAAHFTCIAFDNRGVGRSQPRGDAITIAGMADDARAILDAEDMSSAHVVGHSVGGLVALELAVTERARIVSLSLLCTFANGRAAAPLTPRMMWLGMRARVGTRRMRRHGFLGIVLPPRFGADPDRTAADLAVLFGHDLGDQEPATSAQLAAMRATDLTGGLGALGGVRTLVVSATHDPIAPPALGRALAAGIPGARFVEVADASHGLPITHAAEVNSLLREHISQNSS
jgi:pimeloyl-ACP methyl ester carboxylesterase